MPTLHHDIKQELLDFKSISQCGTFMILCTEQDPFGLNNISQCDTLEEIWSLNLRSTDLKMYHNVILLKSLVLTLKKIH